MIGYDPNWQSVLKVCSYKTIKNKNFLIFNMSFHFFKDFIELVLWKWMIYLSPINGIMSLLVIYDKSVIRRPPVYLPVLTETAPFAVKSASFFSITSSISFLTWKF